MSKIRMEKQVLTQTVILARDGDSVAFDKLVKAWYNRIYHYCLKYMGDHDQAMEACQRTFIQLNAKISDLREPERFKPWLYTIAGNFCKEEKRSQSKLKWSLLSEDGMEGETVSRPMPKLSVNRSDEAAFLLEQSEIKTMIHWALQQIPADQRKVVIMKEYEGFKFREIAEVLEVSENTIKSKLYYGLSNLRKAMDQLSIKAEHFNYGG